uniref:Uncharacterized protein n=1 Tax=Aegilops tauschii subsp. strangulata TaxID=200361 RepID=A0A453T3Q0_AEGTS
MEFANNANKITCDPELQNDVNICISRGRADFDVFVLQMYSPEEWEHATLVLRRTGYQVNLSRKDEILIDEKYSPNVQVHCRTGTFIHSVLMVAPDRCYLIFYIYFPTDKNSHWTNYSVYFSKL